MNAGTHLVDARARTTQATPARRIFAFSLALNLLASIHLVWFYLASVPSGLNLLAYEHGQERIPFQQRMLFMLPFSWAHHSAFLAGIATMATHMSHWLAADSGAIAPETVLETAIDLTSVVVTGWIARRIYQAASPSRLLTPFVYPLTLAMITLTYTLQTSHAVRFFFDLPAMAFFATGLYLAYFRRHPSFFIALFLVATMNRETSLLLLPLCAMTRCHPGIRSSSGLHLIHPARRLVRQPSPVIVEPPALFRWEPLWSPRTLAVILSLSAWWLGWHLWVVRHFAANASASGPRFLLNLETLLIPMAWPQLLSALAYLWPFTLIYRALIRDPVLRYMLWLPGAWLAFMLSYGLLIETRIFGELIPYFACTTALIAEQLFVRKLGADAGFGQASRV